MIDLTSMLINLSNSLQPIQALVSGLGYLIGIAMIISGLEKFKKLAASHARSAHTEGGIHLPFAFICGGGLLLYLPSSFSALSNTLFGATNILSYSTTGAIDPFHHAIVLLIETSGLVFFVRGTVLIVNSSKPGEQEE